MNSLDLELTRVALKMKNLVLVDCSFPHSPFVEFKKNYDSRLIWIPCRQGIALELASGLSVFGKIVVAYGLQNLDLSKLDPTLNVKLIVSTAEGTIENLEERLRSFGPQALLIPETL